MIVLGVNPCFHDTAAALLIDGKLVHFVEEERLIRQKHAMAIFPEKAIQYCLDAAGLDYGDVDAITCGHQLDTFLEKDPDMPPYHQTMLANPDIAAWHKQIFCDARDGFLDFARRKGIKQTVFAPHHQTHLDCAYFGSGWDETLVLSIDGRGEQESAIIARGKGGEMEILDVVPLPSSLGLLYATVTAYLGYRPFDGEGTVMGLAAYGEDRFADFFDYLVTTDGPRFKVLPEASFNELVDPLCKGITCPLVKRFGPAREFRPDPRDDHDEHIAASLQAVVERSVAHFVGHYIKETGIKKLCLGGGVALNSKMNGQLRKQLDLEDIYAFPVAGDAGCAIGSAIWCARQLGEKKIEPIWTIYNGPEYSVDRIEQTLADYPVSVEKPSSIADATAELLARHDIVGWFQGQMEGGPRALGSRSILSNPTRTTNKDNVNNKVKFREPWRPFAPSMLREHAEEYMGVDLHAPFMTVTFDVPKAAQKKIPAAMHVDNTIRVQTIRPEDNPLYRELITCFHKRTSVPVITNTSFNRKGEPIVDTPRDALEMFMATAMDALAIGPFLVKRK